MDKTPLVVKGGEKLPAIKRRVRLRDTKGPASRANPHEQTIHGMPELYD